VQHGSHAPARVGGTGEPGRRRNATTPPVGFARGRRSRGGRAGEGWARRTVRVGREAGEQPGGGAAVAEQPVRRPRGRERLLLRRRHADLAGAAVGPLERARSGAAAVRAAAGLAGGEAGGLCGVEPAEGRRRGVVPAAGDGLRDGRQERARRGAVPRQLPRPRRRHRPLVVRRRQAVHRRPMSSCCWRAIGRGAREFVCFVLVVVMPGARWCGRGGCCCF